jgi:Skp family chaperone for outer membrane proteins
MEILGPDADINCQPQTVTANDSQLSDDYFISSFPSDTREEQDSGFLADRCHDSNAGSIVQELEQLKAELRSERMKVQFYQLMLKRSQEELDNLRAVVKSASKLDSFNTENANESDGIQQPLLCSASETVLKSGSSTLSLCDNTDESQIQMRSSESPVNEQVSVHSGMLPTLMSDTDEGVGSERHSTVDPVVDVTNCQQCWQNTFGDGKVQNSKMTDRMKILTLELERKTKNLATVRQMLKELSTRHHDLLEKNFSLEEQLKQFRKQQSSKRRPENHWQMFSGLQLCVDTLRPVIALCAALLKGSSMPDLTACFLPKATNTTGSAAEQSGGMKLTMRDLKSLQQDVENLRHTAISKLMVARYIC